MTRPSKLPFDQWWAELQKLLAEPEWGGPSKHAYNPDDWRDYWEDDYTPKEARAEDASYA